MSQDFLSIDPEQTINRRLSEVILENSFHGLQFLQCIYNEQQKPVDFRFGLNDLAPAAETNTLLSVYPDAKNSRLFHALVLTAETGRPLDDSFYFCEEGDDCFYIRAKKFKDGIIVTKENGSESNQAEERLMVLNRSLFAKNRELEALSSELKTFNTIAANDYNETLRSLYTCLEFIISNDAKNLSDAGKANLRRAQAAIQKMKLLTDDIVAFSKITPGEPLVWVDLNEILAHAVSSMEKKIAENHAVISYNNLPSVHGYPLLLSILFSHLVDNAIKFRKEDTAPRIQVAATQEEGINITHAAALKDVSYRIISIIDNGIGFDVKEADKIFTMFYKLHEKGKNKGSGIGLAICKKIMDLHGGFIVAECNPECTTFRCFFPVDKL